MGNPLCTAYMTTESKDRQTILDVLRNGRPRVYLLNAKVPHHRERLDASLGDFWSYYDELLAYREHPMGEERIRLATRFDELFAPQTGYAALDERIAKTRAKQDDGPNPAHLTAPLSTPSPVDRSLLPGHSSPNG